MSEAAAAHEADNPRGITGFKNRSRVEIVANMLSIARSGALKTRLMYKANLSYLMVTEYLDYLSNAGLIKEIEVEGAKVYQTTKKGIEYLQTYDSLRRVAGLNSLKKTSSRFDFFD